MRKLPRSPWPTGAPDALRREWTEETKREGPMSETRGIRGATTVDGPRPELVTDAVGELLDEMERTNEINISEVAAAIFTLTDDLPGAAPAAVARSHGWGDVPLLQVLEHGGATGIQRCIRVLVLWNTRKTQAEVRHVYLRDAVTLRPEVVPVREEA
jgi:chorismate mutase